MTDYVLEDFDHEVGDWRDDMLEAYDICVDIVMLSDFLHDDGGPFQGALANFRKVAMVPPSPKESVPEGVLALGGGEASEGVASPLNKEKTTLGLLGAIVDGIAIIGLIFLGIYKLLTPSAAVLGIFGALVMFFAPSLTDLIKKEFVNDDGKYAQTIDSIFEYIFEDYKHALDLPRTTGKFKDDGTQKGAYHDELFRDPVKRDQVTCRTDYLEKLGVIIALSEKEIFRRRRISIKAATEASASANGQSIRPQVKA